MNVVQLAPPIPMAKPAPNGAAALPDTQGGDPGAWQREMARAQGRDARDTVGSDAEPPQPTPLMAHAHLSVPAHASPAVLGWSFMRAMGQSDELAREQTVDVVRAIRAVEAGPVRVHVQNEGGQVAVWLGLDGDAHGIEGRATAILSALHKALAEKGRDLTLLVCNGRLVYEKKQRNHFYHQEP